MHFNQFHSAIDLKAKQLTEHHLVLFREQRADEFSVEQARFAEILSAQIVLLLAGNLSLDGHYLLGERILVVTLVQL